MDPLGFPLQSALLLAAFAAGAGAVPVARGAGTSKEPIADLRDPFVVPAEGAPVGGRRPRGGSAVVDLKDPHAAPPPSVPRVRVPRPVRVTPDLMDPFAPRPPQVGCARPTVVRLAGRLVPVQRPSRGPVPRCRPAGQPSAPDLRDPFERSR